MCSYRFPLLVMINGCLCKFAWWLIYYCANLCWLLWTQVHGSVVRAVDCRSAGPWFNSGWRSWFTFMTCSDNPMNQISQMFISKSPITRKSVKKFPHAFRCFSFFRVRGPSACVSRARTSWTCLTALLFTPRQKKKKQRAAGCPGLTGFVFELAGCFTKRQDPAV